jgi:hypothetical protein
LSAILNLPRFVLPPRLMAVRADGYTIKRPERIEGICCFRTWQAMRTRTY